MTIRNTINKALKDQKRTTYWLAKASGVSYGRLHPFLSGRRTPAGKAAELGVGNLEKVMRALGLELTPKSRKVRK